MFLLELDYIVNRRALFFTLALFPSALKMGEGDIVVIDSFAVHHYPISRISSSTRMRDILGG